MPDEFPTLEAVAALATLVALVRMMQLRAALAELERLSEAIARELRAGNRQEVRRLGAASEGAGFSTVTSALIEAMDGDPQDRGELVRTVEQAAARVAKRSRRASTSGGLIGLLLLGLLLYAIVSRVSPGVHGPPSALFDVLVVLGVVILVVGIALNQLLAKKTRSAARRMAEAANGGLEGRAP